MKNGRTIVVFVLTASLLYGIVWAARLPMRSHNAALAQSVAGLEEDIAGLQSRLHSLVGEAPGVEFPNALLWTEASKANVELSLQKVVVQLASNSGMKATTFNNSRTARDTLHEIASFNIEMEGPLDGAYQFLADIEAYEPKIAVGTLRIRPGHRRPDPAESGFVQVQVDLWVYWAGPT